MLEVLLSDACNVVILHIRLWIQTCLASKSNPTILAVPSWESCSTPLLPTQKKKPILTPCGGTVRTLRNDDLQRAMQVGRWLGGVGRDDKA